MTHIISSLHSITGPNIKHKTIYLKKKYFSIFNKYVSATLVFIKFINLRAYPLLYYLCSTNFDSFNIHITNVDKSIYKLHYSFKKWLIIIDRRKNWNTSIGFVCFHSHQVVLK